MMRFLDLNNKFRQQISYHLQRYANKKYFVEKKNVFFFSERMGTHVSARLFDTREIFISAYFKKRKINEWLLAHNRISGFMGVGKWKDQ